MTTAASEKIADRLAEASDGEEVTVVVQTGDLDSGPAPLADEFRDKGWRVAFNWGEDETTFVFTPAAAEAPKRI